MEWIEIIVILFACVVVFSVIGNYVYRRIKHLPTGECACCHKSGTKLVKQNKKRKQQEEKWACCQKK